ncbi:TIM-barrel domain-containing protein [Psychroserpens sp.]|uniref:TIM-barrel domain-containing protein n=1 Tax=Psychroserpens sp. TaxID=2020870 RepID=UPI001B261702|nr:TIM-barrel domain-containing protein [Psychroserpens sp.]MBO6605742.1 glycosyl hydrolase [Psychroserpens sp.]MBO6630112.1 glycosyl hydrolase [Psychroserpens sp.]MBO6652887.1 glycosyl hydrolase [Psychroserpens sp.]MBO6681341.1 glycosyl hydrolase [Psychroserpens sp.]MBO6749116.1 glycosyl hydrolase [Psychroserpens sp.]
MKNLTYLLIIVVSFHFARAQNPDRKYQSHNEENGIFSVVTSDGTYQFQFYSDAILETSFIPTGETMIMDSHAVVMKPEDVQTTYTYEGNDITFGSAGLSVIVTTEPFQIRYNYKGDDIISEKRGYHKSAHVPMDMVKGNIVAETTEKIEFNLEGDEALYGGGARALGMNRRGNRLPLFNRAHYGYQTRSELMNYTMPIVLSSNMYLIHFDNAPIGYLDLDSNNNNTLTYETISGRKTYQLVAGDSWYDIIENYTDLTGKQPMLPRWALGNFSSRFGYHSQQEVVETIKKFKEEEIPVDAIILDLYWFGKEVKGTMGNLEWHRDSFPNPELMIKQLRDQDVETILITEPFILTTSNRWQEAVKKDILAKDSLGNPATYDFYFGNTGIIDIYSDRGNSWFKDIYKDLSTQGITGFWGDLGEPEVHPGWVQHATGSADEIHNTYGHDWAKLVYESSLEANPNLRPFILMRAGYSGSQRYGMIPWTGDVSRSWGGLQSQPEIALQMGMQGIGYMHSDLGGFAGANLDDELYARWLQYGVFQPIFRPHAQEDVASEPVYRSKKAKDFANYAIQMRYRLLPYNYHLMAMNHIEGRPLMTPLFFEEPKNKELYNYTSTYLWGKDILVSPVLESGKTQQDVYFPAGSYWFDIENDAITSGGTTKTVDLHEAYIPTYVRAGAFIPLAKPMQSTKDYDENFIQLQYYHHDSVVASEREFYFDDGASVDPIQKGIYQILEFEAEQEGRWLEIDFEADTGENFAAGTKTIQLVVHNLQKEPTQIKLDKQKIQGTYNEKYKTLSLTIDWNTDQEMELRIKRKK